MKTLLILTGPQGSGNHLWSKIFALHPAVLGWQALLDQYWIGHDQEPWADCWRDPELLKQRDWSTHDYYVTSISNPYVDHGSVTVPNIVRFAACAMGAGLQVKIAVLGRDKHIVALQEQRVRGTVTVDSALAQYQKLQTWSPVFLSYELLQLYRAEYLTQISTLLNFPIDSSNPKLHALLADDSNQKYVQPIKSHWVDDLARKTSRIQL